MPSGYWIVSGNQFSRDLLNEICHSLIDFNEAKYGPQQFSTRAHTDCLDYPTATYFLPRTDY